MNQITNHDANRAKIISRVMLGTINVAANPLRPLIDDEVRRLAVSMQQIGMMTPITVRYHEHIPSPESDDSYELITGRHRVEAARSLGWDELDAIEIECSDVDAKLWEIAENLHRAELTKLQHDEQVALWIRLMNEKDIGADCANIPRGRGQPKGGVRAASRDLGIDRDAASRAIKVASLSDEAKDAAREHGLDDNRTALLEAARETESAAQVAKIVERATRIAVPEAVSEIEAESYHECGGTGEVINEANQNKPASPDEMSEVETLKFVDDMNRAVLMTEEGISNGTQKDLRVIAGVLAGARARFSTERSFLKWLKKNDIPERNRRIQVDQLYETIAGDAEKEVDMASVAPPEQIAENVLYTIDRMNENARVCHKHLKLSVLDREAVTRINTAIDGMIKKWRSIQSTLEKESYSTAAQPLTDGVQ
jgi:ParB-like chromosome segregation protein Spo0J